MSDELLFELTAPCSQCGDDKPGADMCVMCWPPEDSKPMGICWDCHEQNLAADDAPADEPEQAPEEP